MFSTLLKNGTNEKKRIEREVGRVRTRENQEQVEGFIHVSDDKKHIPLPVVTI